MSKKINNDLPINTVIQNLSQNNNFALKILNELLNSTSVSNSVLCLTNLEDMNITGHQICIGYVYCKFDINKFVDCLLSQNSDFIKAINIRSAKDKIHSHKKELPLKAINGGAIGKHTPTRLNRQEIHDLSKETPKIFGE